jgi:HSP20 family protein
MAEAATKLPVKTGSNKIEDRPSALQAWHPFESLHREIDRLFDDVGRDFWRSPFRRSSFAAEPFWRGASLMAEPAVDVVEKDNAFEIAADLPGLDEKNVEVHVANGVLTIRGEKKEEKEEKKKDYYLHERQFGSFERSFGIPDEVDVNRIEAAFKKGVLTVTLPKKPEAQKPAKKIEVKAA